MELISQGAPTKITADTDYILYGKIDSGRAEAKDTLWTSSDSINFAFAPTEGLSFKVLAYSGVMGKAYRVKSMFTIRNLTLYNGQKKPIGTGFLPAL